MLQNTLDANWRGAYDILGTAKGAQVGADGLPAPNSLGVGGEGMTLKQLAEIRKIPGGDVAAPIGQMVTPLKVQQPMISLPVSTANAASVPQAFRLTMQYTSNDGISQRYVAGSTEYAIVDELPPVLKPVQVACNFNGFDVDIKKYPQLCQGAQPSSYSQITVTEDGGAKSSYGQGVDLANGVMYFNDSLVGTPSSATRITLNDPVAERKLLGEAGDFLAPCASGFVTASDVMRSALS